MLTTGRGVSVVLLCIAALLGTGLVGLVRGRARDGRPIVYGACLAFCVVIGLEAVLALGVSPGTLVLPLGPPWLGAHFRLDALASCFLAVVNLGGAGASLYGIGHGRHETMPERVLPFYPVFLAGLNLVVIADDACTFLFAWGLMSLASWALVVAHRRDAENARAGLIYLIAAGLSGLALLLALGLLAGAAGNYGFEAMRRSPPADGVAALVLLLALLGAGGKAGLAPLHAWLPMSHPAAPSHVSALMSGVMTKVAIYAFLRIVFDLLGPGPWWGAMLVLALGGATAVLGILYALIQSDLKRLLAYNTVENVGIIFIGIGLAMGFRAAGFAAGAALALTAAMLHVVNHAVFKSLLFFGAGAVQQATGTCDMEHLGGLIHRLPKTAFAVLIGCAAAAALPPLNGFVSEWLTFQAILLRPDLPQWGLNQMILIDAALLALAAALGGSCFVKLFGIAFLGRARGAAAARAQEADRWSLGVMLGAAALCVLVGVLPGAVIDALSPAVHALLGVYPPAQLGLPWISIVPVAALRSSYDGLLLLVFISAATVLTILAVHRFASRATRHAPAWDCGFPDPSPATQYTGDSFAQPLRRVFGATLFHARETVSLPPPGDTAPARMVKSFRDPASGNPLQFRTRYLGGIFVAVVLLLVLVFSS